MNCFASESGFDSHGMQNANENPKVHECESDHITPDHPFLVLLDHALPDTDVSQPGRRKPCSCQSREASCQHPAKLSVERQVIRGNAADGNCSHSGHSDSTMQ